MPVPAALKLLDAAVDHARACHGARVAAQTESDIFRAAEALSVAERAVRLIGCEVGRQWLIGLSWASTHDPQAVEDMLAAMLSGRLKRLIAAVDDRCRHLERRIKELDRLAACVQAKADQLASEMRDRDSQPGEALSAAES